MRSILHSHSLLRIFAISTTLTLGSLVWVWYALGTRAAIVALILILIEITFSFENAIINARVLAHMSLFWQRMFLTIGILIAIFGMRLVFPIAIVALSASIPWTQVVDLALNDPTRYAAELERAHPVIAAFGGMFLLMLVLHFFLDSQRRVRWISVIERPLQHIGLWWLYAAVAGIILAVLTLLPINPHPKETAVAGSIGIIVYLLIHGMSEFFTRRHEKSSGLVRTGMAGFIAFMYLEILDASFSLDGVVGAFAITNDVILIAIGLGVGALWVRSLTVFMVRKHTLHAYRYLEHGAHYTIAVLAFVLLIGVFQPVPEVIAGIAGICLIGASIYSSRQANRNGMMHTVTNNKE